jgi:NitT/TauT family transport system substrate-binding protein/putative hydroxymethylpyrimidine transport system substrate-binding protein
VLAFAGCGGSGSTAGGGGSAVGPGSVARTGSVAFSGSGVRTGSGVPSGSARAATSSAGVALPRALARTTKATLILDFTPNAVHAGIYRALAAGYYRRENIDLQIVQPGATVEPLSLVSAGRAQFGLADGSDVASEIAHGGHDEAVAAIVQQPLGGLIALASAGLRSPAQLQGRAVGITGVPSDLAVLDTEIRHAGGDPAKVHVVTVGFNGAQALLGGRIAAFTGFVPDDGVQLQVAGHPITPFWLDREGGPAYPGLVAFANRGVVAADPALIRDFLAATVRGYEDTLRDPARSLGDLLRLNPSLPRALTAASLKAYLPLFADGGAVPFGTLQPAHIVALSRWMLANDLIATAVPFTRYGTDAFLPSH